MASPERDKPEILEDVARKVASLANQIANSQATLRETLRSMKKEMELIRRIESIEQKKGGSHVGRKKV